MTRPPELAPVGMPLMCSAFGHDQDRTPLTRIRCRRRLPILLRLVPLALMLGTSSALAFDTSKLGQWGSLPLEDLASVIAKSARLQEEISQVLSEGNKKQEDVTCLGMRFPGQWKHLGGSGYHPTPAISVPCGCKSVPPFVLLTAGVNPSRRSRTRR